MTAPAPIPTRRHALGLIGAAALIPRAPFAEGAAGLDTLSGRAFGTRWRIVGAHGQGLARLRPGIAALFARIDREFSPYRPDSTLSRFNAAPAGARMGAPALGSVTTAALDIARRSAGAFDPTVGPLVARWGFGPIAGGGAPDWRGVSVGSAGVTKARDDLTLDLCGIAKGWALDRAADLARAQGFDDLLLELGGEFTALGRHPDGRAWRIAVEAPLPTLPPQAALTLPDGAAVATSGTRAQSFRLDGGVYGHVIDPATRRPATGALRSVTVVAGDAMQADGWATALFAAGARAGPELAQAHDIAALFLTEAAGALRHRRTGAIAKFLL